MPGGNKRSNVLIQACCLCKYVWPQHALKYQNIFA